MTNSRTYIRSFQTMLFNIFNFDTRVYKAQDFTKVIKKEGSKNLSNSTEEEKLKINFLE